MAPPQIILALQHTHPSLDPDSEVEALSEPALPFPRPLLGRRPAGSRQHDARAPGSRASCSFSAEAKPRSPASSVADRPNRRLRAPNEPPKHAHGIGEQAAIGRMMGGRLNHGAIHPQCPAAHHSQ